MTVQFQLFVWDFDPCVTHKALCLRAATSRALYLLCVKMFAEVEAGNVTQCKLNNIIQLKLHNCWKQHY